MIYNLSCSNISDLMNMQFDGKDGYFIDIDPRSDKKLDGVITDKSNIVFRIAYLFWILRGSNVLVDLLYYSDHMFEYSDNGYNLRGAYGPRLLYWVGADQLQEAININMNIDDEDDFVKPGGINQLQKVFEDFHYYNSKSSTFSIIDPAIDFDPSNDVPDLVTGVFFEDNKVLNLLLNYARFNLNENHINDLYVFRYILKFMSKWTNKDMGRLSLISPIFEEYDSELYKYECYLNPNDDYNEDFDIDSFFMDIDIVFHFDRHLRNMLNEKNLMYEDVSMSLLADALERKMITKIQNEEIRNMAFILLVGAIKIHLKNNDGEFEEYIYQILQKMSGPLQYDLCKWLLFIGDNPHRIYTFCMECIAE